MKCSKCGQEVKKKNAKFFRGNPYGPKCFKKYIVPKIERIKDKKKQHKLEEWNLRAKALIKTLESKDLSNISNDFKLKVIPELIEQFNSEGWLSKKQYNMVEDWLNQKDRQTLYKKEYEYGLISLEVYHQLMGSVCRAGSKKSKFHQMRGQLLTNYRCYGRDYDLRVAGACFFKDEVVVEEKHSYKLKEGDSVG